VAAAGGVALISYRAHENRKLSKGESWHRKKKNVKWMRIERRSRRLKENIGETWRHRENIESNEENGVGEGDIIENRKL
jgi:hypothetical protein